ncbi:MAG: AMP-binding protein [Sphingomonas bacterium]
MAGEERDMWRPDGRRIAEAEVTALARAFGLEDYDALHRLSLERPDDYWMRVIDVLGIVWSRRPDGYVRFDRGPEFPDWFPGGELNWVDTVLAWCADPRTSGNRAIVAEREDGAVRSLTFAELGAAVRRFAAGLRALGVRRGDRVGLLTENGVEATVSLLALSYVGAIVVPLFSGFGADAIVSRLEPSGVTTLIATTGFDRRGKRVDLVGPVRDALRHLPSIGRVIWKGVAGEPVPEGGIDWHDVARTADDGAAAERMSPSDPFMVIYTSGTTGKPKGAVHTHGGFPLKIAHDSLVHFNVGPGKVYCWPADMGWIAGTLVLSCALLRGATLVCYDGAPDYPDWSRMSRVVERHGVTHYGSAPTLIRGLAANEALALSGDRSTVELLITAGEGIDPEHFLWFQRRFGADAPVINYTGGTEVSGALLSSVVVKPIRPAGFNTGSPGVDVVVLDAEGRPVIGEVGELSVRRAFVGMTQSFWQDDERYLDSYWRTVPGTWVHGDLAMELGDGSFFMLGRSDDTLKVAGKRLGPAEVEEVVLELEAVSEAAAIGVPDAAKGEKLVVFVIAMPGWAGGAGQLGDTVAAHVADRLGKPFRPSRVHLVRQLPKTRSSKVMRRVIKRIWTGQPLGDLSALDNPGAIDELQSVKAEGR